MTDSTKERDVTGQIGVEEKSDSKVIELRDMYKFKPEELALEISETYYSNVAYMQVAPRDVIIDFLEFPGMKKDGKMVVHGVRVFLSHVAAQSLAERLGKLLENTYKAGQIEKLEFSQSTDVEITTKISRPSEEGQI